MAATIGKDPEQPFLGYVLFLENHAPHECGADDASSFPVLFADTADFVPTTTASV